MRISYQTGFVALKSFFIIVGSSIALPAQDTATLNSKPLTDLIEQIGLAKNSDVIIALWAWEEPAECASQVSARLNVQRRIADQQ